MAGLLVGLIVGLTGMGGGALMTPVLVLFFHVQPLVAVGSDLVASVFMKPLGSAVHWRRGTVEKGVVLWLVLGSVPAAFAGVFLVRLTGHGQALQAHVQWLLGAALLVACAGILARSWVDFRRVASPAAIDAPVRVRRLPTLLVGAAGGLIVGMTSVGSGSLVIVALMSIYPALRTRRLVGTDLVQAVPMVGAAALGHVLAGDSRLGLTLSILLGAIPGVYIGSRLSASSPDFVIRPFLFLVLMATGTRLLGVSAGPALAVLGLGAALAAGIGLLGAQAPRRPAAPAIQEVAA